MHRRISFSAEVYFTFSFAFLQTNAPLQKTFFSYAYVKVEFLPWFCRSLIASLTTRELYSQFKYFNIWRNIIVHFLDVHYFVGKSHCRFQQHPISIHHKGQEGLMGSFYESNSNLSHTHILLSHWLR